MRNSTVVESYAVRGGVGYVSDSAIINVERSVFANSRAGYAAGFYALASDFTITDCIHRGSEITIYLGYMALFDGCTVNALRNVF